MIARGVYPPPSQFEAWFLSGAHSDRDIDFTIRAAREVLNEVSLVTARA
jgi:glutamate-1-semialdehyde 2,1-aminomutase